MAVLDADDAFLPNRLERLHGLAEQLDPWCVLADRSLRVAHSEQGFVPLEQIPETIPVGHSVIAPAQVLQTGAGGSPFFSRELLETSQARYPVGVISAEDIAFLLLLLRADRARFVRLRDPHYLYAVQEGSLTTSTERYCDRLAALAPLADDDRMPPDLRASIARHLDEVQRAQPFEELRGALRSRRPLQAAAIVARHPRILPRLPALYRTHRRYRSAVSDAKRFADQASAEGRAPEGSR